jgi:replication factor C small subunit
MIKHLQTIAEKENLKVVGNTIETIAEFSEGDLRRAINILQTSVRYEKGITVNEKTVLHVVGQIHPKQIQIMINRALNDQFIEAREMLQELMASYGLSGVDIIRQIHRELYKLSFLSPAEKAELANIVGEYDFRLSEGANEDIQLSALLAQFTKFSTTRANS